MKTQHIMNYFSNTYLGARIKFKKYSKKLGIYNDKILLENIEGSEEEPLYIDIAYIGSLDPSKLLIHSSGVNGISGFVGSAIQCAILDKYLPDDLPSECAILFVHSLNPYGMSHYRKFNENNVFLDKNFQINKDENYSNSHLLLNDLLNLEDEPIFWSLNYYTSLIEANLLNGKPMEDLKNDIINGQNVNKKEIYYTGKYIEQGPDKILKWIKDKFPNITNITHIDIDTDYGIYGKEKLKPKIYTTDNEMLKKYQKIFNFNNIILKLDQQNKLIDIGQNGTFLDGVKKLYSYSDETITDSNFYGIKQTFGTFPKDYILQSLITENYYHNKTNDVDIDHFSKQDLYKTYCPKNKLWRKNTLNKGITIFKNGIEFCFN